MRGLCCFLLTLGLAGCGGNSRSTRAPSHHPEDRHPELEVAAHPETGPASAAVPGESGATAAGPAAVEEGPQPIAIKDTTFAASVADGSLELRGAGILVYRLLFDIYAAALYLPPEVASEDVFSDVPKRLVIHYFYDIPKDTFAEVAAPILEESLDRRAQLRLRGRVERLNRMYRDVRPGDRYTLDYVPGKGTTLLLNDEPVITVPGVDFQAAYYSIWLGEICADEDLRDALLGSSE